MALHSHHGSMMVVASYGQGCRLMVEFEHTYRQEGAYQPQMTVYSDSVQGNLTANFQGHIHVINRLYSARFESHNTTAVGQKSKFQVQLISPSMNVSYHWSIVDEHGNSLGTWNTSDQFLQYNFTEAGLYQVNVVASNIINSVQAGTSVVVQETISDLQLTCNPSRCIRVDQLLHCIATVGRGSNPKFTWKIPSRPTISPSVSKQPSLSMANYTFDMPGGFNISVQAKNDVSDVTRFVNSLVCVQEPVACVSMESYGPTLLGTKTEFEITVEPMAFVRFRFKSGPENRVWENVLVKLFRENDAFYVAYQFEEAGIHDVTVTAYNNVSSTSHSIKVLVMRAVPPLDVRLIGVPVVGRPATLQVIPQWPPGVTDNLEYEWHIGNYTLHGTGSTIITTTFSRPGYHQVNVMAANFVENRTKTLYVEVMESASVKWYLSHDIVTPVHQPVEFTLQGEPSTWSMLHVEYDGPRYIKHVVDATDYRWSQEFTEAGLYQTVVTMETANAGSNTIESLLLVQETITGLQLTGPQLIQMEILYKDYFWEAAMDSGTDVMYQWSLLSLSDGANITGAPYGVMDKYRNQFDMPGVYSLVVTTRNNVSQAEASLRIIVSYPVIQVTVETRPNPLGHTSIINITVTGADNFNVQVDFGDNSSTEVSTSQYNSNIFGLLESYKVTIPHLYTSKGIYKVKVNVSNQVSAIQETREVLVGEPITGITLHTTSPSLVQVAELVVVTATVATGDDLTFEWDFSDEVYQTTQYLKVVSEGNTSTANYSFSMAGEYAVSVRVSNVLYTQPFIVSLDFNFHVMEPVSQLTIEIKEKITGLPLQGSAPNISTSEVHFSSRCGGSDVMFEFDFGDGVTKQVPGILLQFVDIMEASYSHRYTKEGVYNVSVTARNSLSEMTSYLAFPFHVQLLPPQRLQLHPEMIRTPFGEVTTFTASVTVGTNFTFDWKFGDQSDIVNDAGPTVTHEYTQVGSYDVTVIAKNDVFQLTKTAKVDVLHRIQRVNLILTKSVVETNEMVVYGAETFPKNADVSYFVWNFGVQAEPKQSHEPVKEHMYTIPSRYTVTVSAHNHLSHVESEPELVYVQSPVSEYLEIRYNPKKKHHIVDENSSFSVYHFSGSNLNYTWDFGDGTENKTTKSKTMSHIYTSVGEYVIRVWAENMLSRTSASDNIFVLRKKCVKPELVIHGEFTKGKSVSIHVKRSKELYVEVELKNVDCDVTNATAYRWTFYNTSTGQEVELHTLNDDILRKKILRIPARVLPYGTYNLKVRVMVRETIVHSECQTKVSVDPTPLMCSIKGGVYRQVRRDSLIILDGTDSVDSDTTNQSSLRYNWTCYVDYDTGKPCFKENLTDYVTMDTSRIAFPGSILKENITDFMMKLTVMAQNREPVECTQMVHISDMLELNIYCPQCEQSLVNWDWPLSFQAVCASCDLGDLEYEWTMYMVPHLSQSDVNHHYDKFSRSCAIAGQTHISKLVHNNKTMVVNVDSSRLNTGMSRSDPRTEEESSGKTSTTTPDPVGLYFLIEDVAEGRSRAKENSSPITFQESRLESRLSSGRQRGSRNEQNILDILDIPHKEDNEAKLPDVDHTKSRPNSLDMSDIPQMDHGPNTLDLADIPQMDHGPNTLDMADIPQMDHGPNTIDLADIPQMDHGSNTIDMADFPQMDHGPNTLDLADIPQMDHGPNMLDMADIPGRENSEDSPEITNSDDITNMADFSLIEDSHFNMYNSIIEENTRVESSRRKPIPHTDMYEVKEGNPGEEGSSIARNPAYDDLIENKISEIRPKPDINEGSPEQDGETPVFDGVNTPTARQKHILQHAYHRIMLIRNATLTGLNKRSLVLKPNNQAILQGFTYIMHVKATSKDGLAKGHAIAKFKVNQSPHQGDCSVKPDSGFEMSTEFTIFCKEWRDVEEHLPLWYEVSYNLEETDVRYVIYRGLQSSINFRLPAGNPSNNHRVLVYITILDSLSGRTPVCHAPLTVKPRPPKQVDVTFEAVPSPEEIIFYEAFNENGSIVKAQEQGYEHRVKVLVRYLATRLNQLPQYGSEVNRRRQEIRHRLLAILKYLPMRDELEVIQTLQALAALTQVSNELNQAELDLASAVFRSILDRAGELYVEALTPPHELLTLAVTTASNVISATVHSAARNNADQRWFYQTSMSTSIYTLNQLLKNELKFHAVGQQPIQKHAHYVETMASRFSLQDRPVLGINQSKFTLPKDMSVILKKDRHPLDNFSPNHDCFQVHMTKFLGNPYVFDGNRNTKVASEVGALKIYTCDGEPVEVSGLQDDNMVTMEIPRLPLKEETTLSELLVQHRLERTLMNLHQFNVSGEQQHQSLNIIFTLTPAYEDRLFPIALMIGFQGPPTPDSYLLRHEFDVSSLQAKLFLPAEYFNG